MRYINRLNLSFLKEAKYTQIATEITLYTWGHGKFNAFGGGPSDLLLIGMT
jgi:hypothetical protein